MHNLMLSGVVLSFILFLPSIQAATQWYVWSQSPADGPGRAWSNAFHTLQAAADAAVDGDTILVTNGVYAAGGRAVNTLMNRLAVTRAVQVRSINGPAATWISGGGPQEPAAARCVYLRAGASLIGFTLTNGHTLAVGDLLTNQSGGGALLDHGGMLSNCVVKGNAAAALGGGIACLGGGLSVNCVVERNTAAAHGGGLLCHQGGQVVNCTISDNTAQTGGGLSTTNGGTVINTILRFNGGGNWTDHGAGSAYRNCATTPAIGTNCVMDDPHFINRTTGDYRLSGGSRCVNAGTNANWMTTAADLAGNPRIRDGVVDVGALESDPALRDSNDDGVPDVWCRQYGLDPVDPEIVYQDPDHDGRTTLQEYAADTNPTNAQSFFKIADYSKSPTLRVMFPSSANRYYTLQSCTNLSSNLWINVPGQSCVPGNGGLMGLSDTAGTTLPSRQAFYRVEASATSNQYGAPLSAAQTEKALNEVIARYRSLTNIDKITANESMAQYLATRPEFIESGATASGAWARFSDGILVVYDNENTPETYSGAGESGLASAAEASVDETMEAGMMSAAHQAMTDSISAAETTSLRHGLPDGDVACVFSPINYPALEYFKQFLDAKQYRTIVNTDPTVESLRTFPRCSVFLLIGHSSDNASPPGFCVYTTSLYVAGMPSYHLWDLLQGRLAIYHYVSGDWALHYAITKKGVAEWWQGKFDHNSLVIMDTCRSFNPISLGFRKAILNNGASVYAGWTFRELRWISPLTELYLIDRLLGVNQLDPSLLGKPDPLDTPDVPNKEKPPQRPFDFAALKNDMKAKGLGSFYDDYYKTNSSFEFDTGGSGDFGLLAPSIYRVTARGDDQLQLIGLFGKDPGFDGKVEVDGKELTIKLWEPYPQAGLVERILCDLPRENAGSIGNVQVTVRKHESNIIPLSEYRPDLVYTFSQGKLTVKITYHLRFRVDLHKGRREPGKDPQPIIISIFADQVSKADYECSGSQSNENIREEWSGKGSITELMGVGGGLMSGGSINQNTGMLRLYVIAMVQNGLISKVTDLSSGKTTTTTKTIHVGDETWDVFDTALGNCIEVPLKLLQQSEEFLTLDTFKRTAKNVTFNPSGYWPSGTATLQCDYPCAPAFPPNVMDKTDQAF